MSQFLKQRVAAQVHESYNATESRKSPTLPWYGVEEEASESSSEPVVAVNEVSPRTSPDNARKSRLRTEVDLLEQTLHAHNFKSIPPSSTTEDRKDGSDKSALDDLNAVITEVESLVRSLQSGPKVASPRACSDCPPLRSENVELKSKIVSLEVEVSGLGSRCGALEEELREARAMAAAASPRSPTATNLMTASARLKAVTAALNKALNSNK